MAFTKILLAVCGVVAASKAQEYRGIRQTSLDVTELSDRLATLENVVIPQTMANAEIVASASALDAAINAAGTVNADLALLLTTANSLQNEITAQVSTAVRTALQAQLTQIQSMISAHDAASSTLADQITLSVTSSMTAATDQIDTSTPAGKILGYKECSKRENNGAEYNNYIFMKCHYNKTSPNSVLYASISTNGRQIDGSSRWQMYANGKECSGTGNQGQGRIWTGFHGSGSADIHYPYFVGGFCWKTNDNQVLPVGVNEFKWQQFVLAADSFIGWESSSRIRIEEWLPDAGSFQVV